MTVTVLLFGPQAQQAGRREVALDLPGQTATCADIRRALAGEVPALHESVTRSRLAVNHEYADDQQPVREGDEVALIGMVSGG